MGLRLHECTRLEIEFGPSAIRYFFADPDDPQNLLNSAERDALEAFTRVVCEDQESIRAFADDLRAGYYQGLVEGEPAVRERVHITCYQHSQRVVSFTIFGTNVKTEDGHLFVYNGGFPHFHLLAPQVRPFQLRADCARNLRELYGALLPAKEATSYPSPEEWGDAVMRKARLHDLDRSYTKSPFECPGARTSDYAINVRCRPDSSRKTVLFFEATPGWNQYGGPELFTFDNHDPRGGLVLLNDRTVKFIRTEEELKQLRWK